MVDLDAADRRRLDYRQFACVNNDGTGHLPINDREPCLEHHGPLQAGRSSWPPAIQDRGLR